MTARIRPFNFSAGPAMLPEEVLREAAAEMLDWHGSGMGVMEMSHRGKEFIEIYETAVRDLRGLLAVPPEFRILFMQGGGLGENAIVPMNLSRGGLVDVVVTGAWSKKSLAEAGRYANANVAASNEASGFTTLPAPASWDLREGASYLHLCSNETIHGVEFQTLPDLTALGSQAPLVVDCSSHILSRSIDWSRVGLAFAGAQKNIGPAGLTIVFVREDLLGHALPICPTAFDYSVVAEHGSMFNTPPTYGIYIAGLVFQHVLRQGGVAEMARRAIERSQLLYRYLDDNGGFYRNPVAADARSRMNVPFFLADASHNEAFLAGAREAGLLQLKGHKSVGGMRASLYNAMPLAGVQTLVEYMKDFVRRHG
ncbi:MAG TPA: 3-phosphoserine/phosphohydroxythreonine transaminase [Ideonella sp.]|uniref:3-phosphoserine/phosphohydroxythreonine transaminase n=1 Tax=Ideonella sp. TaxID=1929293 RepID=UPI002D009E7B|nr:3-phosphoserine/phosphohydroxythreonine transaminase [Ideonella sp.]HSI47896.1 3-phosphoserine/phosphohydroxythreonine transaminase [Ideonella sp.]